MKLYKLINGIGTYWVVANDPTEAENKLTKRLSDGDYGFSSDRVVTVIYLVAEQITEDLTFGLTNKYLLL